MNLTFFDTSILVYAYDADAGEKNSKAQRVLRECWENESGALSVQVLQEFYVTVTQKLSGKVTPEIAREVIQTYQTWPIFSPNLEDILAASEVQEKYQFSFWDSLIVVAAQRSGASQLYSEDLRAGQQIGPITIVNPLV